MTSQLRQMKSHKMEYKKASYRDIEIYNLKEESPRIRFSTHFVLGEFACKDESPVILVHPDLPLLLDAIRKKLFLKYCTDVVININSGYRTVSYNKKIGGEENSRHIFGMAADIVAFYREDGRKVVISPSVVAEIAEDLGAGGVGLYDTFTHVDVFGENRRFDKRTNAKRSI